MNIQCPKCKQILNIPDHLAGQKIQCSKCKHCFSVPTQFTSLDYTVIPQTKKESYALLNAAQFCILVAAILNFISFLFSFIFYPLYLVAFILSIVAITRGQTIRGIATLFFTILCPVIMVVLKFIFGATVFAVIFSSFIDSFNTPNTDESAISVPVSSDDNKLPFKSTNNDCELNSFCGIDFGMEFNVSDTNKFIKDPSGETLYYYEPDYSKSEKILSKPSECYVIITPETNEIHTVILRKNIIHPDTIDDSIQKASQAIKDFYQVEEEDTVSLNTGEKKFVFKNGSVYLKSINGVSGNLIEVRACNTEYNEINNNEKEDLPPITDKEINEKTSPNSVNEDNDSKQDYKKTKDPKILEPNSVNEDNDSKQILVPKDCKTIKDAVKKAKQDTTILLQKGSYYEKEDIAIPFCITIKGETDNPEDVVVYSSCKSLFTINNNTSISNITIVTQTEKGKGTSIVSGSPFLENCIFRQTEDTVNKTTGIFVTGSKSNPKIINCIFKNFKTAAIVFTSNAKGSVSQCKFTELNNIGIAVNAESCPDVGDCLFSNNENAVYITNKGQGIFIDNKFEKNKNNWKIDINAGKIKRDKNSIKKK